MPERKKLAIRQALSHAAFQLAVERGMENVTVEDITAEANVALRTFSSYFASKYEAICSIGTDRAPRYVPPDRAGAVTAASQVAVRRWFAADPAVPLRPLLALALRQLAVACSEPPEGS